MPRLSNAEYLVLGRRIVMLLGSAMQGPLSDRLRELARAYDPGANEAMVSAEVFLFNKYLLVQACVGIFPTAEVDYVVGGLVAALNERAGELELSSERQQAMEEVWQARARKFEPAFVRDREYVIGQESVGVAWEHMIDQFCRNVKELDHPPDIWAGADGPSHLAGHSVTEEFDRMRSALGELNRTHFNGVE